MMIRRRVLPVLAAMTLMGSLVTGMAAAVGRQPGWTPSATIGPANGVTYPSHIVVTGPGDAWSTWSDCAACSGAKRKLGAWIEHWNGRAWRRVVVPEAVAKLLPADGIGATSADDLWLFVPGKAAHWNGKHWGIMKIPSWVVMINRGGTISLTVSDFGPTDLWVISGGAGSFKPFVPFAARYNGHHWTKVRLPAVPSEAVGVGPADIWATAMPSSAKAKPFLMHWNGKSWVKVTEPRPSGMPAHSQAYLHDPVATGPDDVWLQQDYLKGEAGARTDFLWHWNGRRWTRIRYRFPPDWIQAMAADGHGGLWVASARDNKAQTRYFAHYSAGRWSQQLEPAPTGTIASQVSHLAQIPGTRSMWALGNVFPKGSNDTVLGEIWRLAA